MGLNEGLRGLERLGQEAGCQSSWFFLLFFCLFAALLIPCPTTRFPYEVLPLQLLAPTCTYFHRLVPLTC